MSDEAAFLEVLKANPADDTTRLVYADWLDEHDQPQKAEYLRLTTQLPLIGDDVEVSSTTATRVSELGALLPAKWKESAAGRFDVVLLGFNDKVRSIKRVREVLTVDLASSKGIVECAPNRIAVCAPFDGAVELLNRLTDNTGMSLVVRPCERKGKPHAVLFQVLAECTPFAGGGDPAAWGLNPERDTEASAALARLVAEMLEVSQDSARAKVKAASFIPDDRYSTLCFILANDIPLPEAQRIVERCRPFFDLNNNFGLDCHITGRVIPEP